jgi:hypothetical protein
VNVCGVQERYSSTESLTAAIGRGTAALTISLTAAIDRNTAALTILPLK